MEHVLWREAEAYTSWKHMSRTCGIVKHTLARFSVSTRQVATPLAQTDLRYNKFKFAI